MKLNSIEGARVSHGVQKSIHGTATERYCHLNSLVKIMETTLQKICVHFY